MTLPGDPPRPAGPPAPGHPDAARDRGHLRGARLRRWSRAPRSSSTTTTSPRSTTRPTTRRGCSRTPSTSPRRCCCARTPRRCRCARWRRRSRRSTSSSRAASTGATRDATHTPMFHQLEGLAIDEDITLADLRGVLLEFARAMFGEEREVRLRSRLLPLHRAERGGGRVLLHLRRHGLPGRRLALPDLQGLGLDRDPRLGDGRPERARLRGRTTATTPSACRASRSAWASSASRCSSTACPTCACCSRTTSACWSSSAA